MTLQEQDVPQFDNIVDLHLHRHVYIKKMYACGMTVCLHESTRPWIAGSGPWVVYQEEKGYRDTKTRSTSIVIKLTEIQELFDWQRWWREPGVVLYFGVVVFQESEKEPHLEKLMRTGTPSVEKKKEKKKNAILTTRPTPPLTSSDNNNNNNDAPRVLSARPHGRASGRASGRGLNDGMNQRVKDTLAQHCCRRVAHHVLYGLSWRRPHLGMDRTVDRGTPLV